MASDTGVIYGPDGIEKNCYVNGDGYVTASVKLNSGIWRTFGVHRLVALTFIEPPSDPDGLTVNHRDGDIKNNVRRNLEWVTVGLNNLHAALLRGSIDRAVLVSVKNDERVLFRNLQEAANFFGVDPTLIWDCVQESTELNGWMIKPILSARELPVEARKEAFFKIGRVGKIPARPLKVMDLQTKEVTHYGSLVELSKSFNVDPSHIGQLVSVKDKIKLFKRKFIIVEKRSDFPVVSAELWNRLKGPTGQTVIAYNFKHKRYVTFESASKFVKFCSLSKKAVTVRLKKGKIEQVGDWLFTYLSKENLSRLRTAVSSR
jgi:HNH endonuclease